MTLWWTEQALSKLPADKSQFVIILDRDNCENALDTEYLQKVAEIFQVIINVYFSSSSMLLLSTSGLRRRTRWGFP